MNKGSYLILSYLNRHSLQSKTNKHNSLYLTSIINTDICIWVIFVSRKSQFSSSFALKETVYFVVNKKYLYVFAHSLRILIQLWEVLYQRFLYFVLLAIAKVYLEDGNKECREGEAYNAIHYYTEGLQVNCKDMQLNAKIYSNRATAHFLLGKKFQFFNGLKTYIFRLELRGKTISLVAVKGIVR